MKVSRREFLGGSVAGSALLLGGCTTPYGHDSSYLTGLIRPENQNTVFHWVDIAIQQVRDQRVAPPRAAYNFAAPMVAGFLAANAITQDYEEPFGVGTGNPKADAEVAYGTAFTIAAAEVFQQPFAIERMAFRNRFPDGEAKSLGIDIGEKVAEHILDLRTNDGSEPSKANFYLDRYQRRTDSLRWRPSGPFYSASPGPAFGTFDRGLFPGHGKIKPWTMKTSDQFRVKNFYDPRSPEFAREYDMVRRWGGADSTIRTPDESEIALFWEDGPWGVTPPGHFLCIAMQVLQDRDLSFIEMARAFALLGMTQADASISAWDSKYHHDVVRPENAIRVRTEKFQNTDPRMIEQSNWNSYIPTPPFPSYTSGHSTFGAAGAEMTALIYGSDNVSFSGQAMDTVLWPTLKGVTRSWTSLSQAAEENGMSRIYGGVHWELDHTQAMLAGRGIARQAFENTFPRKA